MLKKLAITSVIVLFLLFAYSAITYEPTTSEPTLSEVREDDKYGFNELDFEFRVQDKILDDTPKQYRDQVRMLWGMYCGQTTTEERISCYQSMQSRIIGE